MMPSDDEDEAPVAMKRCTVRDKKNGWHCFRMFPASEPYKLCPHHREAGRRASQRPESKAKRAERAKTPEAKQKKREYSYKPATKAKRSVREANPQFKAKRKEYMTEYNTRQEAKELNNRRNRKWNKTEKGRAKSAKHRKKPLNRLAGLLRRMSKGGETRSLIRMGCFESNEHVKAHFESTMDKTWMTWENHRMLRADDGYRCAWNFGHKLPRSIFDQTNPNDCRKCFMPMNLFSQDARENVELKDRLVYSNIELEALRPCWPDAAMNSLVLLKALFAGAAARAVAEGSSAGAHSAAEDSEAADSEEEGSGAETEAEATAAGSEAAGSAAGSEAAGSAAG